LLYQTAPLQMTSNTFKAISAITNLLKFNALYNYIIKDTLVNIQ